MNQIKQIHFRCSSIRMKKHPSDSKYRQQIQSLRRRKQKKKFLSEFLSIIDKRKKTNYVPPASTRWKRQSPLQRNEYHSGENLPSLCEKRKTRLKRVRALLCHHSSKNEKQIHRSCLWQRNLLSAIRSGLPELSELRVSGQIATKLPPSLHLRTMQRARLGAVAPRRKESLLEKCNQDWSLRSY